MIIHLATENTYYDLHLVSDITLGTTVIVKNETSSQLFLAVSPTTPTSDSTSVIVGVGEVYSFSPKSSNLWIKGSTGPIHVETLTGSTSSVFGRVDLPPDIYTSNTEGFRRLRIDTGQTGFFEGREFRTFWEVNLASGASRYFKFTSPVDFILIEQSLSLDSGSARFTAISGAADSGTYNVPLPIIGKNRMASRKAPYYTAQTTILTGGAATGGTVVELFRVVAANATAQQQTVLGANSTERGLPAGTYHLRIENIGSGSATGVYTLIWEERP